jgi:predicted  nucleic acid-binding Zn-ribbon protein
MSDYFDKVEQLELEVNRLLEERAKLHFLISELEEQLENYREDMRDVVKHLDGEPHYYRAINGGQK